MKHLFFALTFLFASCTQSPGSRFTKQFPYAKILYLIDNDSQFKSFLGKNFESFSMKKEAFKIDKPTSNPNRLSFTYFYASCSLEKIEINSTNQIWMLSVYFPMNIGALLFALDDKFNLLTRLQLMAKYAPIEIELLEVPGVNKKLVKIISSYGHLGYSAKPVYIYSVSKNGFIKIFEGYLQIQNSLENGSWVETDSKISFSGSDKALFIQLISDQFVKSEGKTITNYTDKIESFKKDY